MTLPKDFEDQMRPLLGDKEYTRLTEAIEATPSVSIRTNPHKPSEAAPTGTPVAWCKEGAYLKERPSFTLDPLFHAGAYYVQEASSMFLDYILRKFVNKPSIALDLCAAPGGKSTVTLSALPEGSMLIANEIVRQRSQILAENITKWGNSNVIVTNNCAEDFQSLGQVFDIIICDAPCSGEGMFRKDAQAIEEWSVQNVEMCSQRQRDILTDIWPCLKPGGLLVYSTCTYNTRENEENALWAKESLGAEIIDCDAPADWNITGNLLAGQNFAAYHFFPHKTQGEGFFACVLRKSDDCCDEPSTNARKDKKKKPGSHKEPPFPKELKSWISDTAQFAFISGNTDFHAFPMRHKPLLDSAISSLKVIHYGIQLASMKGKAIVPAHSLAMSNELNNNAFPSAEVNAETALAYLRTESVTLPPECPKGYILLKFDGIPLGFAKNIGTRANNLYPQEWRIRHAGKQ
jgi:16S rRNA C967 or C1407 C5-methylase (RsmB/RsmF family)/NOL1/NOP2/fmu family ribosome biogenesis protein